MPSSVFDSALLRHLWGTDELRAIFSEENRVQKWYDYEAALARAQADLGIIPKASAAEITAKARVADVDLEAIGAEVRHIKHPLVPALRALQGLCADGHGEYLHFGPTTQDVLDTGLMLQVKDAHAIFLTKKDGHTRCMICHIDSNNHFRLERMSPGASSWNEEQSRKNFEMISKLVNPGDPDTSMLTNHPLAPEAGGHAFHSGGRQFNSKDDPDWKILVQFVNGAK